MREKPMVIPIKIAFSVRVDTMCVYCIECIAKKIETKISLWMTRKEL